ncbi:MAG: hypothetical protein SFW07_04160 [Gammaproteobacteria bacterium]|nr:hypothetical protein [Gammaproteobacteria bacterium]
MAYENTHEQQPSRFARWRRERAAKKTYNLALKDLRTTKKLLEKYKPARTPEQKTAAAREINPSLELYAARLMSGLGELEPKNKIYGFIAKQLASIRFEPEVRKFLASDNNISIPDKGFLNVPRQEFWTNFGELDPKDRSEFLAEIFALKESHHDYHHIVDGFQNSLSQNYIHSLLNNSYLPGTTKQELLKLVFNSPNRDAEAFSKILFSQNSQLTASEIRAALPDNAEDLPKALVAALKDSLNSSTLKLSDKFFVLDILNKYPSEAASHNANTYEALKPDIEILYNVFFPDQSGRSIKTSTDEATFFPLIVFTPDELRAKINTPNAEAYFSTLIKRLGIPGNEVEGKTFSERVSIIIEYKERYLKLLSEKLCEQELIQGNAEIQDPAFKDKVEQLQKLLFNNTSDNEINDDSQPQPLRALNLSPENKLKYFHEDTISLKNYLDLDRSEPSYEKLKRNAFDHALSSETQRHSLTELALLPNDPYGARQYLEEKSHPGFWSRVSRKLFWWTEHNKKEIELTNLAKNTFDTLTPKVELPLLVRQEIPVAPEEPISAPIQRSSSASKIVAATMRNGSPRGESGTPELLRTSAESSPRSFDSEELENDLDEVVQTTPSKRELSATEKAKQRAKNLGQKVANDSKLEKQSAKRGLVI